MNTFLSSPTMAYTPLACDRHRSVLGHGGTNRAYTAFGRALHGRAAVAFNGERPEPTAGHYILGHGYRAYSPTLMRFERSDDASPFGEGGINSYAYCGAEPVNRLDPSGRSAGMGFFGIVAGLVVMAWGGVERANGNETKSNLLLGIGGGILAISVFGMAVSGLQAGKTPRSFLSRSEIRPRNVRSNTRPRSVDNSFEMTSGLYTQAQKHFNKAKQQRKLAAVKSWPN